MNTTSDAAWNFKNGTDQAVVARITQMRAQPSFSWRSLRSAASRAN